MKFLPLVWKNIWRRKIRTFFTLASIFVAFVLFGILMTIRMSFTFGVEIAGVDRLILINKINLIMPLPIAYEDRVRSTPGVEMVTHNTWFNGLYQNNESFFATIAVDPEPFLKIYKEFVLPPDQLKAWLADRRGAIVGRDLAERFGWKLGDQIPLQGTIYRPSQGEFWDFTIAGIYDGAPGVDRTQFFFRYDYLDENRGRGEGEVGWYIVKIADASKSKDMATTFDGMFANSSAETETTTEKGFVEGFAKQMGDIGAIMIAIVIAVLFNILLIATTTMVQSVRERTNELALLKTLGYSGAMILGLVLAESVFVAVLGGGLGLLVSWLLVQGGDPTGGMLPIFVLPPRDVALGAVLILLMGILAGMLPAIAAMRLRITDALRRA